MLSVGNMLATDGLVVAIDKAFHRIVDDGAGVEVGANPGYLAPSMANC